MFALDAGQQFLREYSKKRLCILPRPDVDGLAGAVILRHLLGEGTEILLPDKGTSLQSESFQTTLQSRRPQALILIGQNTCGTARLKGLPTLVIDHHMPHDIPHGILVTSQSGRPPASSAHLCYLLAGSPPDNLWLGAVGDISENPLTSSPFIEEAGSRYTKTALLETIALIDAGLRSSRFDWFLAIHLLAQAGDPRQIVDHEIAGVLQLVDDHAEVMRELSRSRKYRPFFADPWAVIPFSSPCRIQGTVASNWRNRLHDHYVLVANFGYRPGEVHFSACTVLAADLPALFRNEIPGGLPLEWSDSRNGLIKGSLIRKNFLLFLTHLGFTPEQVIEIDRRASRPHQL